MEQAVRVQPHTERIFAIVIRVAIGTVLLVQQQEFHLTHRVPKAINVCLILV